MVCFKRDLAELHAHIKVHACMLPCWHINTFASHQNRGVEQGVASIWCVLKEVLLSYMLISRYMHVCYH